MNGILELVIVVAVVTALLRFLPFIIFSGKRAIPDIIRYLGTVLPYSIMGMLVVYCLKDISFAGSPEWLPIVFSSFLVVGLHIWKRNMLLSIVGGTICYMCFIRIGIV